ncbi:hypothetical protein LTR10_007657 [Elasticomyces elasticus]|nr:hypothetical protein LTR10_007657 [Elasticomyces elasticus]KAK4970658.1 hypothetical protein LTR42_007634 [Elasticomyces elasticus]
MSNAVEAYVADITALVVPSKLVRLLFSIKRQPEARKNLRLHLDQNTNNDMETHPYPPLRLRYWLGQLSTELRHGYAEAVADLVATFHHVPAHIPPQYRKDPEGWRRKLAIQFEEMDSYAQGILQRYDHALRIPGVPHDATATQQALVLHDQHQPTSYIAEARYRRLEETSSSSNNGYGLSLTETNRWVSHPSVSPSGKRGTSDLTQTAKTAPQQRADSGLGSDGLPENSSLVGQRPVLFSIWRDPTDFASATKTANKHCADSIVSSDGLLGSNSWSQRSVANISSGTTKSTQAVRTAPQQYRDNAVHGVGLPESSRWVSRPMVSSNTTTLAQAAKTAQQERADNVPGLQVLEEVASQLPGMAAKTPMTLSINTLETTRQLTQQPVPSDTNSRPREPPRLFPKVAAFATAPSPQPCDVRDVCADHLNGVRLGHDKVHLSGCEVRSCYNKLHICRTFWDSARTGNLSGCGHGGEGVKHKDHRGRAVVHLRPNCHIQYPRQRGRTFARARPCENTATRPCYYGHDDPLARRSAVDASQWRAPRNVQNEWTGRWEKQ